MGFCVCSPGFCIISICVVLPCQISATGAMCVVPLSQSFDVCLGGVLVCCVRSVVGFVPCG